MKTPYAVANRRMRKRIDAPFAARLRTYKDLRSGGKSEWDMVLLRNISAGGALFLYDKEIEEGALFDFVINVPGRQKPVECQGMALRVEGTHLTRPFNRVAVCFTDMKESAVESIDAMAQAKA